MADYKREEKHDLVFKIDNKEVTIPLRADLGLTSDDFISNEKNPNGAAGKVVWKIKGQTDAAIQNEGIVDGAIGGLLKKSYPEISKTNLSSFSETIRTYLISKGDIDDSITAKEIEKILNNNNTPLKKLQLATDNIINEGLTKDERVRLLDGISEPRFAETDTEDSAVLQSSDTNKKGKPIPLNAINATEFKGNVQDFEVMYYPEAMLQMSQDHIKFESFRYESDLLPNIGTDNSFLTSSKGFGRLGGAKSVKNKTNQSAEGTVILPISSMIKDSNSVDWGPDNINPLQAEIFRLAYNTISGDPNKAFNDFSESLRNLLGTDNVTNELKAAASTYFASRAAGVGNQLSRATGAVFNPNLTLLFNNPTLRSFGFSFYLSARNTGEVAQIKKIIRFFKQTSSVRMSKSELFLLAPNVYRIRYFTAEDGEHRSIGKMKTCALLGCDVDYTPDGSYMTFDDEDKTMTAYRLTLRFQETDPVYYNDYDEFEDQYIIGY